VKPETVQQYMRPAGWISAEISTSDSPNLPTLDQALFEGGGAANTRQIPDAIATVRRYLAAARELAQGDPPLAASKSAVGPGSGSKPGLLAARVQARVGRVRDHAAWFGSDEPARSGRCRSVLGVAPDKFRLEFADRTWGSFSWRQAMADLGLEFMLPPGGKLAFSHTVDGFALDVLHGHLPALPPLDNEQDGAHHYVLRLDVLRRPDLLRGLNEMPIVNWGLADTLVRHRGLPLEGSLSDGRRLLQVIHGPSGRLMGARIVGVVPIRTGS
jgi:hypothetical protein